MAVALATQRLPAQLWIGLNKSMKKQTINKNELLDRLEVLQPGLSAREIIEQSSCFVFDGGWVRTFNDEISCAVPCDLPITGAVQAKTLLSILRKLPEDELSIMDKGDELLIQGKNRRCGVRKESEVTLPISNVEMPEEWQELPGKFLDALRLAHSCVSKDESQFSLTCVNIAPKWVEACDNFQLTRYKLATGMESSTLVRGSSIHQLLEIGTFTHFCITESWIHFQGPTGSETLTLSCRRYLEDYPDLNQILKAKGDKLVLPKGLVEAADKAGIFATEMATECQVKVTLAPGKLSIRGEGVTGWFEERKKIAYTGPAASFLISPLLLAEVTKKYNACQLTPEHDKLVVHGSNFRYVTSLGKPDNNEQ